MIGLCRARKRPHPVLLVRTFDLEQSVTYDQVCRKADKRITMTSQRTLAHCRLSRNKSIRYRAWMAHLALYGGSE